MDTAGRTGHNATVKRSSLWLLPLLLAVWVGGAWYFDARAQKADRELPVYVTGGERMAAGEPIYRRGTEGKPFTYPPFAAVPFVPFAAIPPDWQPAAWFTINYAILLLLLRWLDRWATAAGPGRGPARRWWFWVPTAVVGGRHVLSVFTNQSHDLLIAGLVALTAAAWCRGRSTAGVWAGLGAAVKATPLLFVGLFGLRGRWLALCALLAAAIGATLLPDFVFPRADGGAWWRSWYEVNLRPLEVGGAARALGAWNSHSVLNQSLSGALVRLFRPVEYPDPSFVVGGAGEVLWFELPAAVVRGVTIALQLGVLALIAVGVRAARRAVAAVAVAQRQVGLGEVAAFACGMVLLSPQSSKSHFCVWLFPVAFVADFLLRSRRDAPALALALAAAVFGLLSKELLGRQLGNLLLAWGNVTWSTVLLLLATVRCLTVAGRATAARPDAAARTVHRP